MKTLREQISNKCVHFNGLMNKRCENGIAYDGVKVKGPMDSHYKMPCFRNNELAGGNKCLFVKFPTEEEVNSEIAEASEEGRLTILAMSEVKKLTASGEGQGTIKCPKCGGKLFYIRVATNGHTHGKCLQCRLGWME